MGKCLIIQFVVCICGSADVEHMVAVAAGCSQEDEITLLFDIPILIWVEL